MSHSPFMTVGLHCGDSPCSIKNDRYKNRRPALLDKKVRVQSGRPVLSDILTNWKFCTKRQIVQTTQTSISDVNISVPRSRFIIPGDIGKHHERKISLNIRPGLLLEKYTFIRPTKVAPNRRPCSYNRVIPIFRTEDHGHVIGVTKHMEMFWLGATAIMDF